jgi:hypothetical protein
LACEYFESRTVAYDSTPFRSDARANIVSPVEAVFELGEVTRQMLLIDRPVCPDDRGLDIPQCCVDPFEAGSTRRGGAGAGLNDLMGAPGLATAPKQARPSPTTSQDGSRLRLAKIEIE